uniref:CheW-like domain-containing protein n=1 Tax=candidate division WOR-3 bacterium TaxID=2052148 RepID=A0A7V0Z6Y6_UNCW3
MATDINEIKEIIRPKNIVFEGKIPKNLAGFCEFRGKRLWVFDLAVFLGIEQGKDFEIIIAEINETLIGFKVGKVYGIVSTDEIFPYPGIVETKDYLMGIIKSDQEIIQVLSFVKIISGARLKAIQKYL